MGGLRVVHYLNQFYGRIGGEDAADVPLELRDGPVGPGLRLQEELGTAAQIVATLICGDNRAAGDLEAFGLEVAGVLRRLEPDVVIAGPAFNAGRYGLACGEVCRQAARALGRPAVTAMYEENPALEVYRRWIYILPATATAVGMSDALRRLARFALRLARGEPIGGPAEEGYFARGIRRVQVLDRPAAERALDMLLARLRGEPFQTELPLPAVERVPPAPPVPDLRRARIAVVTTGGIVPAGNPDGLKQSNSTDWRKYSLASLRALEAGRYQSIHAGYDNAAANANPNYVVPIDALRDLEAGSAFGELYPWYYVTAGVGTAVAEARRMGREVARDLRGAGVDGVILTAT